MSKLTEQFARVQLAHLPTPLDPMPNLSAALAGPQLFAKRDDCTGLALGGNKARQLEFYIGDALAKGADTLLTTGAVQSNHVRMTVAAARKLGLKVEVQLEHRVDQQSANYEKSGNPLLLKVFGAIVHHYPVGEDENGADNALYARAEALRAAGSNPYVIPLGNDHQPFGALGYVACSEELLVQCEQTGRKIDAIVLASGSASTHAGMLAGLRASGSSIPVYGMCVRREASLQLPRVTTKMHAVAAMIGHPDAVADADVQVDDSILAPGYGRYGAQVVEAIRLAAHHEGQLLDPVYTGKSMAGLIRMIRTGVLHSGQNIVYLHTGGTPAVFAYPEIAESLANGA